MADESASIPATYIVCQERFSTCISHAPKFLVGVFLVWQLPSTIPLRCLARCLS